MKSQGCRISALEIYLFVLADWKQHVQIRPANQCQMCRGWAGNGFFSEVPQDRRKKGMSVINFESKWLKYVPRLFWSKSASLNIYAMFYCTDSNIEKHLTLEFLDPCLTGTPWCIYLLRKWPSVAAAFHCRKLGKLDFDPIFVMIFMLDFEFKKCLPMHQLLQLKIESGIYHWLSQDCEIL